MAQRGPEPQQGTGQNNPDMERGSHPYDKAGRNTSDVPTEQGTEQSNPDTQQGKHHTSKQKQKHKKHGGSHDQASPQA